MEEFVEVETREALVAHVAREGTVRGAVVQGVDLTDGVVEDLLRGGPAEGAVFLGCRMSARLEKHVRRTGGMLFPRFEELPFDPYRATLYTPDELMTGYSPSQPDHLSDTRDAQIYAHFARYRHAARPAPLLVALAYRLHDHAIDNALAGLLHPAGGPPRRVVGVMGGHGLRRDAPTFRAVARLGWRLARRGYFVATGGGPGAMEAANLGAYLAGRDAAALDDALARLAGAPAYTDAGYLARAYAVRESFPEGEESLAIPTWFYGHEPTNLFARYAAKYFANSLREDGLLAIAHHGVVFAPGSAGTVQEVFMDAAQNHYTTFGFASPMVFFGRRYWTETLPVFPLLEALAAGRPYAERIHLTDDADDAVDFLAAHPPIPAAS